MNKFIKMVIGCSMIFGITSLSGCSDTTRAGWEAYGKPHEISVYQWDREIYHGFSTGKVTQDQHSVQFMDKDTGELVDISLGESSTLITKVLP